MGASVPEGSDSGNENGSPVDLSYEDHGSGRPVEGGPHGLDATHAQAFNRAHPG